MDEDEKDLRAVVRALEMLEDLLAVRTQQQQNKTREDLQKFLAELKERGEITDAIQNALDAARRRGIRF